MTIQRGAYFLQAWTRVQNNRNERDMALMRQSLAALEATGAGIRRPYYLSLMAQSYGRAGQVDAALSLLAEALAETQTTSEHWWDAELHRLRGRLFFQQEAADEPQAEASFRQALEVARHQQAKSLKCRVTSSLSRLWQQQGKREEARKRLAPIYNWFTEGFDAADVQEAKWLLEAVS